MTIRKRWIAMFLAAAVSAAAEAQDAAELFVKMPDSLLTLLSESGRKELVEKQRAGEETEVKNELDGTARIRKMTDDYLCVATTSMGSTIEIRRLPLVNRTYVVCLVTTVEVPDQGADSRVEFFTTDWKPLPAEEMYRPATMADFIRTDPDTTSEDFQAVRAAADMDLFRYELSPDAPTLTAVCTTPRYFNRELREKAGSFFRGTKKVYTWRNGRFEENAGNEKLKSNN